MSLHISIHEFLVTLRQQGYSQRTLDAYAWHLERLAHWLTARDVTRPENITRLQVREWGASLWDSWQAATVKQAVSAARAWFRWLIEEGEITAQLAQALRTPKVKRRVQRTVTEDEVVYLLGVCDPETVKGQRDRALIGLLYDSGLRAAEVCRLNINDVDIRNQVLHVQVKGGDVKRGFFGQRTAGYLRAWLRQRQHLVPAGGAFFVAMGGTTPGQRLTVAGLRSILRRLGNQAALERPITTHAFRRGFAVKLSLDGVPDNVLRDLGRWETTQQIRQYTAAMDAGKAYRSPLDNLNP